MLPVHQNTNIMSRLETKLTKRVGDKGSPRPLSINLWDETVPPTKLMDFVLDYFKIKRWFRKNYTVLTIRYSETTGYTLEGPTWKEINNKMHISITKLVEMIETRIIKEYESSRGWERTLENTLAELDEL